MHDSISYRATMATIAVMNRSREAIGRVATDDKEKIPQDRLEKFINGKYHWKALTPSDQMKIAKELYLLRQGLT
jgi:hypothetical protein